MTSLLADISSDARWLLEALLEDSARGSVPTWAGVSAFHLLRTRAPNEHPGFGTALLQWQRMSARFGAEKLPKLAAEAFLALPRAARESGVAARILELWCRHGPLPVEVPGRVVALDHLPAAEAALVAEELALGAHEHGKPSKGVLQLVAGRPEPAFAEARALAELERFARGECDADHLARALAPGLLAPGDVELPEVTARLAGGLRNPVAYTPELTEPLQKVVSQVRLAAASCEADHPAANAARRIVACLASLTAAEAVELSRPDRAGEPAPEVGLPSAQEMAREASELDEEEAVRVVLRFAALSGAVEQGRKLTGLTNWRAARELDVPPRRAHQARAKVASARRKRWDALAGGPLPAEPAPPPTWPERLVESLRTGSELSRDELLASGVDLSGLLFDSPGGPGLLNPDGTLRNALRTWPAPATLRVVHPIDLFDAERVAWQARLVSGPRALLNQLFRETYRAGGRELGRKRIDRLRGTELRPAGLALLARRGWFPTLSPAEVPPELLLGEYRARLIAEPGKLGPVSAGVEFVKDREPVLLSDVPARIFSEAWRDVDEALALGISAGSFLPSPARAELVRAIAPRLGLQDLRVEADHVAFRSNGKPERITLHNARPTDGALVTEAAARARAADLLPFDDDGGVAGLLLGRILVRAKPEDELTALEEVPEKEGS